MGRTAENHSWQAYRSIADDTATATIETDLEGVIRWVSPSVTSLLGWTPDDLRGTHLASLAHPLDSDRVADLQRSVAADDQPNADVPCMVRTAAGGYRAITLQARLQHDADLRPVGVLTTVRDTQNRDAALRALATLSAANRTLVRTKDEAALLQRMCDTIVDTGR